MGAGVLLGTREVAPLLAMFSTVLAGYGQEPEGHAPRVPAPHRVRTPARGAASPKTREYRKHQIRPVGRSGRAVTEAPMTGVSAQRTRPLLALLLSALSIVGAAGVAHAVTASSRFATYTAAGDGVSATANPPAGYPVGELSATLAGSVSVSSSLSMRNQTSGFQTFFAADGITPGTTPSYLSLRSRGNTITLTFADPLPANSVAFNLVDVDVEKLTISAVASGGAALSGDQLGFRDAYNGIGSNIDTPVWDRTARTLSGNGADTNGAAGWFSPTVAIESMTLSSSSEPNMTSSSVIYLWMAAIRPQPTVTAAVTTTEITSPTVPFPLAVSTSGGSLSYSVTGANTAGCALTDTALTVTAQGTCEITANSADTANYLSGSGTFTFTVTGDYPGDIDPVAPTITPTVTSTSLDVPEVRLPLATALGGGAITHTIVDSGTAGCALGDTELFVSAVGTCTIHVMSAPATGYLSGATSFTFTVTEADQEPDPESPDDRDDITSDEGEDEGPSGLAATGPLDAPWWSLAVVVVGLAVLVTARTMRRTMPR